MSMRHSPLSNKALPVQSSELSVIISLRQLPCPRVDERTFCTVVVDDVDGVDDVGDVGEV